MESKDKTSGTQLRQGSASDGLIQLVSFHVGGEEFGLEILRVQEIIRIQPLTRVPNSAAFVDGVINLRGKVIPVIALRRCFGLDDRAHDKQTRIVVVEVNGSVVGFAVDSVSEVLRIPVGTIAPSPRVGKIEREYVSGIGKHNGRLLILLDLDRLLSEAEKAMVPSGGQQNAAAIGKNL